MLSASAFLGFAQCKHGEMWYFAVPALQGGMEQGNTKCMPCRASELVCVGVPGRGGQVTCPPGGWSTAFISQGSGLDPPSAMSLLQQRIQGQ